VADRAANSREDFLAVNYRALYFLIVRDHLTGDLKDSLIHRQGGQVCSGHPPSGSVSIPNRSVGRIIRIQAIADFRVVGNSVSIRVNSVGERDAEHEYPLRAFISRLHEDCAAAHGCHRPPVVETFAIAGLLML
jgi:hypothetical protein